MHIYSVLILSEVALGVADKPRGSDLYAHTNSVLASFGPHTARMTTNARRFTSSRVVDEITDAIERLEHCLAAVSAIIQREGSRRGVCLNAHDARGRTPLTAACDYGTFSTGAENL